MGYHKKFEDSYLDEEVDDFDGAGFSDGARLVLLIRKQNHTDREKVFLQKLTDKITTAAKIPGVSGSEAVDSLVNVAEAYYEIGQTEKALHMWARLIDIAEIIGNRDLYYKAIDRMEIIT
jgi:hypothetical protein